MVLPVQVPARVEPLALPTQYFAHDADLDECDGLLDRLEDIPIDEDTASPKIATFK